MKYHSEWHGPALDDLENTSLSYEEIATKYNRSREAVVKLKQRNNVVRKNPVTRAGLKKMTEMKAYSEQHRALGSRITVYRSNRLLTEVADEIGVSRHVLKLMELGAHDFTLSEITRIAKLLKAPIQELVAPIGLVQNNRKDTHA